MINWTEFERQQPALAAAGGQQLYTFGIGLGFLATVRPDGGPRVHPVCPVISPAGLHVLIKAGPKQADLYRDGRYSLHSETCPPPKEDDGFAITGCAAPVTDPSVRAVVRDQISRERDGKLWPTFNDDALFDLTIDRCLLTLTHPDPPFPQGPTIWSVRHEAPPRGIRATRTPGAMGAEGVRGARTPGAMGAEGD